MFRKHNKNIDVAGSKYDVEDITHYEYLTPIWNILENSPDNGITSDELWKQSELEPERGNKLLKELQNEFQNKVLSNFMTLFKDNTLITNSWAFDKIMLLVTKINTNSGVKLPDNPVFNLWINEWKKKRGI